MWKKGTLLHCWWECKLVQLQWRKVRRSLKKTKNRVIIWSSNPIAGHISWQNYNSKIYMRPMFIATLFTIAKTWKQPKCPLDDEWMKKMWYIYYNGILLSCQKELMPFAATWMDLEIIILSEASQRQISCDYHM